MKTPPDSTSPSAARRLSADAHRYRAERPGPTFRVSKLQRQRCLLIFLLALLILGLFTAQAAETSSAAPASPAADPASALAPRTSTESVHRPSPLGAGR